MPQAPTKRSAKAPASRKRTKPAAKAASSRKRAKPAATPVDRTAKLSEEVLETVEKSQRAAIESVRKFVETVDHALPALPHGKGPTGRQEIVDSALEMADRLVHTQYDFIRKVIDNASKSLSGPDESK
jgi:hypothetical protein